MTSEESVNTGEVKVSKGGGILRASAIGSCVVVAMYDPVSRVGGMAHVMLPGVSRDQGPSKETRYAEEAVEETVRKMERLGAEQSRLCACLVGGANLLGDGRESPGADIVRSLIESLGRRKIAVAAEEVGGTHRRSCSLNAGVGRVTCTIGDSEQRTLWEAGGE